jgi:hypothetical protein
VISTPDEAQLRAMARLMQTTDFQTFLHWLGDEKTEVQKEWMASLVTVRVHQLQGAAQLLEDITQTATSAPQVVAAINRATT